MNHITLPVFFRLRPDDNAHGIFLLCSDGNGETGLNIVIRMPHLNANTVRAAGSTKITEECRVQVGLLAGHRGGFKSVSVDASPLVVQLMQHYQGLLR